MLQMKWTTYVPIRAVCTILVLAAFAVARSQDAQNTTVTSASPAIAGQTDSRIVHIDGRDVTWLNSKQDARVFCNDFTIDRFEVTNREFVVFLSAADSNARHYDPRMDIVKTALSHFEIKSGREECPVAYVDWVGAYAYAIWAGKSLPTEEEWMVAALDSRIATGQDSLFPWSGSTVDSARGNFLNTAGFPNSTAVGSFPGGATSTQIMDLAGNVAEWTLTERETTLSTGGKHSWMVVKGGSFLDPPENVRITSVALRDRSERLGSLGFRCIIRDNVTK